MLEKFLKNIKPREYQQKIFETCSEKNCLVVLPTGIGKTLIALMLTIGRMTKFPGERVVFLAPTKPLAEQHINYFKKHLPELFGDMQLFTGMVKAEKRKKIWQTSDIVFSTPQCVANDLKNNLYDLKEVCLLIEDEAHKCLKNYDYNYIAQEYQKQAQHPRIIGLTASPGSTPSKIKEICRNLSVEAVELRTRESDDVKEYLQELKFEKIMIDFPAELEEIRQALLVIFNKYVEELKKRRILFEYPSKINLINLQKKISATIARGNRNFNYMLGASACAQAVKIQHSLELLETQTLQSFHTYLSGLLNQAAKKQSKGVVRLVNKPEFNYAYSQANELLSKNKEHPKLGKLIEIIEIEKAKNPKTKIIVFTQFRETASIISKNLNKIKDTSAKVFIGQAKKAGIGLSQKEQKQIINEFSDGKINVLCATSIHPDEYIVLKKGNRIVIKKIGEFVDTFIKKENPNKTVSKKIERWEALTSDGNKVLFKTITHIHRHPTQNETVKVKLNSGFDCFITENHSLFSFNKEDKFVPSIPEEKKFVSFSLNCPNVEQNKKIDIIQEVYENCSKEKLKNLFGSVQGLTQAKIRILKTNFSILLKLKEKEISIIHLSKEAKRDYSVTMDCLKRLKKQGFITQRRTSKNYKNLSRVTEKGRIYLKFLEWFFKNVKYHKGKYRFRFSDNQNNLKEFNEFFEQNLNIYYGKTRFPRFLEINKSLARFLGFYVSEESTRKTKSTSGVFLAARNKKIQQMMEESIKNGLKLKIRRNWGGIVIDSQVAYYLIKDILKAGVGAYNKEVPEIIFTSPSQVKWEFLKSYFLGDGYLDKDRITLTTVSRKLVTGLVLLLRMLGVKKITLYKQKNIYRIYIYESLPFAKIKDKNDKMGHSYYSLIPSAINSDKIYRKYKNYYSPSISHLKCRKNGKWNSDICFDYIKKIERIERPKFVYDLSVMDTENFIGGTGLFCLHNSIGEEGLDIPEVNTVIFYEPIPSEIRKIQRAGRTARLIKGKLIMLITKKTRDEAYYYVSRSREKKMHSAIDSIRKDLNNQNLSNKENLNKGDKSEQQKKLK